MKKVMTIYSSFSTQLSPPHLTHVPTIYLFVVFNHWWLSFHNTFLNMTLNMWRRQSGSSYLHNSTEYSRTTPLPLLLWTISYPFFSAPWMLTTLGFLIFPPPSHIPNNLLTGWTILIHRDPATRVHFPLHTVNPPSQILLLLILRNNTIASTTSQWRKTLKPLYLTPWWQHMVALPQL